ncbi:hypothetical protein PAXRUDRAFT_108945, partial [Paxillus rubicundulus Ve08.2h10]
RAQNQRVAHILLQMSEPMAANTLVRDSLYICKEKLHPIKDKCIPTRCIHCQRWGHITRNCNAQHDTCTVCGHKNCSSYKTLHCISCKVDDNSSNDQHCPMYEDKCMTLNVKHPENSMLYYPTSEPW